MERLAYSSILCTVVVVLLVPYLVLLHWYLQHTGFYVPLSGTIWRQAAPLVRCGQPAAGSDGFGAGSCTPQAVDEYFTCTSAYPSIPILRTTRQNSTEPNLSLQHGCEPAATCLRQIQKRPASNTSLDIVVLGDSQALRYSDALVRGFQRMHFVCQPATTETSLNAMYYKTPDLVFGRQACSGCSSYRTSCHHKGGGTVQVEYLRMEFILDFELSRPMRIHWDNNCDMAHSTPCRWPWSTQQFLFEDYLQQNGRAPNHIHVFQNIHDCVRRNDKEFERDLAWLVRLLHDNLSPSSQVHFWDATAPRADKQPPEWRNITTAACAKRMNGAVRKAILPHIAASLDPRHSGAKWHGSYDLFGASLSLQDLNVDGVHLTPQWYDLVTSLLLNSMSHNICQWC